MDYALNSCTQDCKYFDGLQKVSDSNFKEYMFPFISHIQKTSMRHDSDTTRLRRACVYLPVYDYGRTKFRERRPLKIY